MWSIGTFAITSVGVLFFNYTIHIDYVACRSNFLPMQANDIHKLKHWFLSQSRDLPWRDRPTPYAVWISEVMLQQTQVSVVIPYFERWMKRFPSIEALAAAPIEEVLKEWEGLGYYSRARYLHEGARYVVEHFDGKLPASAAALRQIKGLGNYTIGAILSFAFHQRMAAVQRQCLARAGTLLWSFRRYFQSQNRKENTDTGPRIIARGTAVDHQRSAD